LKKYGPGQKSAPCLGLKLAKTHYFLPGTPEADEILPEIEHVI